MCPPAPCGSTFYDHTAVVWLQMNLKGLKNNGFCYTNSTNCIFVECKSSVVKVSKRGPRGQGWNTRFSQITGILRWSSVFMIPKYVTELYLVCNPNGGDIFTILDIPTSLLSLRECFFTFICLDVL